MSAQDASAHEGCGVGGWEGWGGSMYFITLCVHASALVYLTEHLSEAGAPPSPHLSFRAAFILLHSVKITAAVFGTGARLFHTVPEHDGFPFSSVLLVRLHVAITVRAQACSCLSTVQYSRWQYAETARKKEEGTTCVISCSYIC